MKILIPILVLFLSCITTITSAQNTITVKQKGHHNSVSISQSKTEQKKQQAVSDDCKELDKQSLSDTPDNIIRIDKKDTTIYRQESYFTYFPLVLRDHITMETSQMGQRNRLYITLPDSQENKRSNIHSAQQGIKNRITAQLTDGPQNVALSQTGSNNTLAINPCTKEP